MKKVTFRELMKFADQIGIDCFGEFGTKLGTCFLFGDSDGAIEKVKEKFSDRVYCVTSEHKYAPELKQIVVILLSQKVLDMKHTINIKNQ